MNDDESVTHDDPTNDAATAPPAPEERLALAVGRLTRRMRPTRGALAASHFSALATLERGGPSLVGALAAAERASAPSMSRILDALESRGYVERRPGGGADDPAAQADRRTVEVVLTDSGRRIVTEVRAERAATLGSLLAGLDPQQRAALVAALPALERLAALAAGERAGSGRDTGLGDPPGR